ncbi:MULTISPECIES: flagellar biosynthetic protein FliR [unclassified Sporolactobacillus]|uniref:flagellar biosynthetic protein FliR n=1 Tax=unclassified Sporolactobacillus TaxID=2628533 RepID=UPI0023677FF7|nr:flagellar biosynthetic protein FliR [Sporolactobacillus sp. CQH2019]MDD9147050.1 flagellar biosynthetic protein FliR [Sporolactobacillus sp. CQH2019]
MSILNIIPVFLLVLVRIASFLATMPVFSYRTIPARTKIGLAVALSLLIDVTLFKNQTIPLDGTFFLLIIKEAVVGLSMGFVAAVITYAVELAGSFIDLQMGFAIANTISPENGVSSPLTGQLLSMLQVLFFLGVDAHHMLISGLMYSFKLIPLSSMNIHLASGNTVDFVARLTAQMFVIAMQLAMPIIGCLFLVDVAIGLVARTVPQVNVFVVGLPMKIIVGFLVMLIVFPMYIGLFRVIFDSMTDIFSNYMRLLGS